MWPLVLGGYSAYCRGTHRYSPVLCGYLLGLVLQGLNWTLNNNNEPMDARVWPDDYLGAWYARRIHPSIHPYIHHIHPSILMDGWMDGGMDGWMPPA